MTAPLSSLADPADERFTAAQRAKVGEFEVAPEPEEVAVIRAMLELADNLDYYASKTTGGTHASGLEDAAAQLRAALSLAGQHTTDEPCSAPSYGADTPCVLPDGHAGGCLR